MKIAVCGDSWASPSPLSPGDHYSEIIADRLGAELVPLSRGGCSNAAICLQIEFAIEQQVDFVIITTTEPDRIEIPDKKSLPVYNSYYQKEKSLLNIKYNKRKSLSTQFLNSNGDIISENINSLMSLPEYQSKVPALTYYMDELYDSGWKKQIDLWCLDSVLHRLKHTQIPFTIFLDQIGYISEYGSWLESEHTQCWFSNTGDYYLRDLTGPDPGFHTGPGPQIEMADALTPLLRAHLS